MLHLCISVGMAAMTLKERSRVSRFAKSKTCSGKMASLLCERLHSLSDWRSTTISGSLIRRYPGKFILSTSPSTCDGEEVNQRARRRRPLYESVREAQ